MLAIREQSKRLQVEMDRAGANTTGQGDDELDENTMKIVKKVCFINIQSNLLSRARLTMTRFWMTTTPRSSTCRRNWARSRKTLKRRRSYRDSRTRLDASFLRLAMCYGGFVLYVVIG